MDLHSAAGDHQPVQRQAAARVHSHSERIGLVGLPVDQANDGADATGRAQLQRLAFRQDDGERLDVHAALGQLDHSVLGLILLPLPQRLADALKGLGLADAIQSVVCRLRQRPVVLAAADVGAEGVTIRHAHLLGQLFGRKGHATQHRVDGDVVARRDVAPLAQVGGDQGAGRQRLVGVVLGPGGVDGEAAAFAVVEIYPALERAATDGRGQVQLAGDGHGIGFGLRRDDQGRVLAEHAEGKAMWSGLFKAIGRRFRHRIALQAPHEEANAGDVGATGRQRRMNAAHVHRVRQPVEGPVEQVERVAVAQVDGAAARGVQVVDVLRPAKQPVELDRAGRPAGHVARQLLQHRQRALAAAIADRVGHLAPRDQDLVARAALRAAHLSWLARFMHKLIADQIADVRHDPILRRLDEPVVVELANVLLDDGDLLADDGQQRLERVALVGVADAVDGRQQIVQAIVRLVHISLDSRSVCRAPARRRSPAAPAAAFHLPARPGWR